MYTRRCRFNRCCPMNNMDDNNSCDYETICNNANNNSCCNDYDNCSCGYDDDNNCCGDIFPDYPMYAQSYVPIQTMNKTFKPRVGLQKGTIFPELVSTYYPCQSIDFINFIKDNNTIGEGCNG